MPPKDRAPRREPAQRKHEIIDYHRPFYQRSLRREEIQEDLALIQSSMKREVHRPARYGAQGNQAGNPGQLAPQLAMGGFTQPVYAYTVVQGR